MSNKAEYNKIRAVWYKKLKDEGFEDIEQDEDTLKSWSSTHFNKKGFSPEYRMSKIEYYQMATNFLNDYTFESNLDKIIWEYHAEAISTRDIAKLLTAAKIKKKMSHWPVFCVIKRLEEAMKRMYLSGYQKQYEQI